MATGIYPRTEYHKKILKENNQKLLEWIKQNGVWDKGIKRPEMIGEKHPFWGKHHSEETKKKISQTKKGQKYPPRTEIERSKISERMKGNTIWKGKKHTKEFCKKVSERLKGNTYWLGRKHSEMTKQKISKAKKGIPLFLLRGENHPNWLGGKSFEPYGLKFNNEIKEQIRQRDGYRCQECFRHQSEIRTKTNKPYKLTIHHIDYNKQNNNPNNLISLCRNCHLQTNFKREDWTNYFYARLYNDF